MRQECIDEHLSKLAFEFFFSYSRFEFALKKNGYLRASKPGATAMPEWFGFAERQCGIYRVSNEAKELIKASPKRQVVAAGNRIEWVTVDLKECSSDFEKVIRLVQTVRNNLFHGGKHDAEGWDDPGRTERLLTLSVAVLDQIAEDTGLAADYTGHY